MLSRKECLEAAESLAHGNAINRRNAARSLIDYCRIILNDIGSHYPGYEIVKSISIEKRYSLLLTAVPELKTFERLFLDIDKQRNKIEHNDSVIPSSNELDTLIENVKNFDQIFDKTISQKLKNLGTTPYEKLLEDWNRVVYLFDSLDDYMSSSMQGFDAVVDKVRNYFSLAPSFKQLNEQTINETRLELRELQFELKKLLDQGRGRLILKND